MQTAFFNRTINVTDRIFITRNDVKICAHFYSAISYWVGDILKIIYRKLLRYHIYDLVTCRNISFKLISDELINFTLRNFFIGTLPNDIAPGLQTLDMMARNSHVHFGNTEVGVGSITIVERHLNRFDGFVDI